MKKLPLLAAVIVVVLSFAAPAGAAAGVADTVTISGRAYAFNHMSTYLSGATIKVREIPGLSATTDQNGDYALAVPDDTNVTPYIDPPDGYNEIDLQTFHTRGEDIENANFQTPADLEYNALAAILSVPIDEQTGRPQQCAIVTTASARNVRGVDYETFHQRTPHGVPGATSQEFPALAGPIYFNEFVIPDPSKTETSEDGGIIWTEVPVGQYRITTSSPSTGFASFLASCRDGRIINANPPWGAYELSDGERPLAAGVVAVTVPRVSVTSNAPRNLIVKLDVAEKVRINFVMRRGDKRLASLRTDLEWGRGGVRRRIRKNVKAGPATVKMRIRDAAGDVVHQQFHVDVPARTKPPR